MRQNPRRERPRRRHVLPASPNRAAAPPIHVPDPRQVAMHNAVRGSRPTTHRATVGPLSRDRPTRATRPTASVSLTRQPPTPSRVAAAVWLAPAAAPRGAADAAAGTVTAAAAAAAAPRDSSRGPGQPAASRAANKADRAAEVHPAAVILRGQRAVRAGPVAIVSRTPSNLTPDHAVVAPPMVPPVAARGPARRQRARGPLRLRLRPSPKS